MWLAELLWHGRLSPWARSDEVEAELLRRRSPGAGRRCDARSAGARPARAVYRRARRPCPRCGTPIARAASATGTGRRTGARAARSPGPPRARPSERGFARRGAYRRAWPFARRSSTTPCAGSRSARSRSSCASSTPRAASCRSRSRSTPAPRPGALRVPAARARLRRGARRPAARPRGRADRARGARPRARGRHLRACARRPAARRRTTRSSARCSSTSCCASPRHAAASTGTTRRSSAPTPSSSGRCSASAARTSPSRRSSASRSASSASSAPGIRVRAAADGELARHWPEASGLLPTGFGREADRYCVRRAALRARRRRGRHPTRLPRSPTRSRAIRLATAAPLAAGPVLFETLDGRPYGIRPVLPIAATQPPGEPTRLDAFRGPLAAELLVRLGLADADTPLAEALDRWELSLFQHEPFRSEQLRSALAALLGATWPLRARRAARGRSPSSRGAPSRPRRARGRGRGDRAAPDAVRRALVEVLRDGDRRRSSIGSTACCSGCSAPARLPGRLSAGLLAGTAALGRAVTKSARRRHTSVTTCAATVAAWRRRGACSSGSTGSSRCDGRTRARSSCSRSCAPSSARRRSGRERKEVMPATRRRPTAGRAGA